MTERGIVRLRGHKGHINRIIFFKDRDVLVSCGKDAAIKFWDLATCHCFRTLVTVHDKVIDIALLRDDTRLVAGLNQGMLQVWKLTFTDVVEKGLPKYLQPENESQKLEKDGKMSRVDINNMETIVPEQKNEYENDASILSAEDMGSIARSKNTQLLGLRHSGSVLTCFGKQGSLDLYKVLSDEETYARHKKRMKKAAKKRLREGSEADESDSANSSEPQLEDEMKHICALPVHGKISALSPLLDKHMAYISCLYNDNSFSVLKWDISQEIKPKDDDKADKFTLCMLASPGHRGEIKRVQFASVGDRIVTMSNDAVKCWHFSQYECQVSSTITLEGVGVASMCLTPDDRHVVVGTHTGHLLLYELDTGLKFEEIAGHTGDAGTYYILVFSFKTLY